MLRPMYSREGRYLAQLEVPGCPEAVEWDGKVFSREQDGGYVEARVLPPGVCPVSCGKSAPRVTASRGDASDDWGEDQIGNEGQFW